VLPEHAELDKSPARVTARYWLTAQIETLVVDLGNGLSPDEGAVLGVLLNPDLVVERDGRGVSRAQIISAGMLPNPVLGAEYDHPYGPGSEGTTDVLNLSLAFDLKPLFARSARQASARAEYAQIDLGIAWQEWQVAQRARLLVVRLQWLRLRTELARDELEFQDHVASTLNKATAAGDATLGQVGVQLASREAVRRSLHDLERTALETEGELRALFGGLRLPYIEVAAPKPAQRPAHHDVTACLANRLDLAALVQGYDAQEASVREAVAEQFPDLSVGVTHQHNEGGLNFMGAFVNIGLPIFDRNQGKVSLARATRLRLRHEYSARVLATRADLEQLEKLAELSVVELREVEVAIPTLEKIELQERDAVVRGDLDRLSYQTLRASLFDQRQQQAALSQALAETEVGLTTACGVTTRREQL
jgi:hypothetical protein